MKFKIFFTNGKATEVRMFELDDNDNDFGKFLHQLKKLFPILKISGSGTSYRQR